MTLGSVSPVSGNQSSNKLKFQNKSLSGNTEMDKQITQDKANKVQKKGILAKLSGMSTKKKLAIIGAGALIAVGLLARNQKWFGWGEKVIKDSTSNRAHWSNKLTFNKNIVPSEAEGQSAFVI